MGGHRGGLPRLAGARARLHADVADDVGDLPDGDATPPRTVDRVRRVAVDRVAPVRPRLELLPAFVMVPAGEIWRRIVPPLVTTFVVFLLLVRYHVRHAEPTERPAAPPGWPVFVRYLLTTVAAGYGMFLAIVLVFHVWLARDHATFSSAAAVERLGVVAGLRRYRRRAILRVAARDLAAAAVDEVVREISDIADACVQAVCPPTLAVIALGKWGGRELNYASDIDLLLVHGVEDPGATQMVRTLSDQTEGRIALKVDAALRPGGRSAALSRSLEATLAYYG